MSTTAFNSNNVEITTNNYIGFYNLKNYFKILLISFPQIYYSIHTMILTLQIQKCDLPKLCYLYKVTWVIQGFSGGRA